MKWYLHISPPLRSKASTIKGNFGHVYFLTLVCNRSWQSQNSAWESSRPYWEWNDFPEHHFSSVEANESSIHKGVWQNGDPNCRNVFAPIKGDIHAVYSTITLMKKPIDECDGPMSEETPSLETVQHKCRNLGVRYKWIAKQIEQFWDLYVDSAKYGYWPIESVNQFNH
jgi:hypothetical protein